MNKKAQFPPGLILVILGMIIGFVFIPKIALGDPLIDQLFTPAFGALAGAAIGYFVAHRMGLA